MQLSSIVTALFAAYASAAPAESAAQLQARADFKILLCTNYKGGSPRNSEPCIEFTVDPAAVNNSFKVQSGIKDALCNKLATFPGGGCPSSAIILQQGQCILGTTNNLGGCGGTTQVIASRDGQVNFNGVLNDNLNCIQCQTGIFNS